MFPVFIPWRHRRACGSLVFLEDMKWESWQEIGQAQEINIRNKSKDTIIDRKSAAQKKDDTVL